MFFLLLHLVLLREIFLSIIYLHHVLIQSPFFLKQKWITTFTGKTLTYMFIGGFEKPKES